MKDTNNASMRIGRLAGFPLDMHWSVLVIASLLTWSLATVSLPHSAPGHASMTYWLAGAATAVVFFGSLLAHELSHALIARRAGLEVRSVTLWLFGGVASLGGDPPTPAADLRVAAAGPAASLALAVGFALAAAGLDASGFAHLAVSALWWLAGVNLVLGLFNLLPGAPLDGGRVLRALLWRNHGDRQRAALTATRAGRFIGGALIAFGVLQFLYGADAGGLWLGFIGWFILGAARGEESEVLAGRALRGLCVGDVMTPVPVTAPGWVTVEEFVENYLLGGRHSAFPVVAADGTVTGLVTLARLRTVPPADRATTLVGAAAIPRSAVPTATPAEPLLALRARLGEASGGRGLVFQGDRLVGIVTPADLVRAMERTDLQDPAGKSRQLVGISHA